MLVVEDEDPVRELSRQVLEVCGYAVLTAGGGAEALRLCEGRKEPIHLLLTDVVMPHMGGRQVADAVRRLHPETKVLFMSGYPDDAVVRRGVEAARANFLQKPFSAAALARKVREVLDARP